MTTYPAHRVADVVLRDGSTVHLRPVRRADAAAAERLLEGLSDWSRWLRFFSGFPNPGQGRPVGHRGRLRTTATG